MRKSGSCSSSTATSIGLVCLAKPSAEWASRWTQFDPISANRVPATRSKAFAGLALGGGPQGPTNREKYPYLSSECALVRPAESQCKPVIGLCLGAQLMAVSPWR